MIIDPRALTAVESMIEKLTPQRKKSFMETSHQQCVVFAEKIRNETIDEFEAERFSIDLMIWHTLKKKLAS